jgi:hypothetical protein
MLPRENNANAPVAQRGFAQKVFWVRLCRTLALSLRLTVSQLDYQALPKLSHL